MVPNCKKYEEVGVDIERGGYYVIPGTVALFLDMACYPWYYLYQSATYSTPL